MSKFKPKKFYEIEPWPYLLHYSKLARLARDKHSSLFGPFVSYQEEKFFWTRLMFSRDAKNWIENDRYSEIGENWGPTL